MGRGFGLVCRKCRYEFGIHLGVGFGFPQNYQSIMEAAKAGKLGREVRYFLRENPEGTLDCSQVLLQCTACDSLERGIDLSMYIPKDQPCVAKGNWSVAFPMWHQDTPLAGMIFGIILYTMKTVKTYSNGCR